MSPFNEGPVPVTRIEGNLPYKVPDGYNVVLLFGCQLDQIDCSVTDVTGRVVCRRIVNCVEPQNDPYGYDMLYYDDSNWISPRYHAPCTTQVPIPPNYL